MKNKFLIKTEYIALMLLFLMAIIYFKSIDNSLPADSKLSIVLAQSISDGKPFKDISDIREPYVSGAAPLYQIVLSVFVDKIDEMKYLKLLSILNILVVFLLIYIYLNSYFSDNLQKLAIYTLILLNPYLHQLINEITTHSPYLFLSLLTILLLCLYEKKGVRKWLFFSAFFASLAFLTRWVGLSLFFGTVVYLIVKKEYKNLFIYTAIYSAIVSPWFIYTIYLHLTGRAAFLYFSLITNPYSAVDSNFVFKIISMFVRFIKNLSGYYFRCIPRFLFGDFFADISIVYFDLKIFLKMLIGFVPSFFIVFGFVKQFKHSSIYYSVLIYLFALGMFAEPNIHYVVPLLLGIYIWGFSGLNHFIKSKQFKMGVFIVLVLISSSTLMMRLNNYIAGNPNDMMQWIKKNTTEDAVILTYKWFDPIYIYTKRKTVHMLSHDSLYESPEYAYDDPKELINRYEKVQYVVAIYDRDEIQYKKVLKMINSSPEKFKLCYKSNDNVMGLYEIIR